MPVRKIPKNYLGVTGGFASAKNKRLLGFESLLERDYMLILEFDPAVESFEEQPVRIPVLGKTARATSYVPDILVHYYPDRRGKARKPLLAEVKKSSDLERHKEKYAPKFAAAKKYAAEQGWDFRIVTEKDIRSKRLQNLKFLREFHLSMPNPADAARVLDALGQSNTPLDMGTLFERMEVDVAERLRLIPVVWHLVATSRIAIDLDQPLTDTTSLSLPKPGRR